MGTANKLITGFLALGAFYMVLANPKSFASGANAVSSLTSGAVTSIATGGGKGGVTGG